MKVVIVLAATFAVSFANMLMGGFKQRDVNDTEIIAIAQFSMSAVSLTELGLESTQMKITKAKSQVVSGVKYELELTFGTKVCVVEVLDVPWMGTQTLKSFNCTEPGEMDVSTDNQQVQAAANFAIIELNKAINNAFLMKKKSVQRATMQSMDGMLYKMDILVGYGNCRNNINNYEASDILCPFSESPPFVCHVKILEHPLKSNHFHLKKFSCDQIEKQTTNNLIGGKSIPDKSIDGKPTSYRLIGGNGHDLCHYGIFEKFQKMYKKTYFDNQEEKHRFKIFCKNMETAKKLQENEKGSAVYGPSKFADMTATEFSQYVGKKWDISEWDKMARGKIPEGEIPAEFDWRNHGAVTPVKNQGSCGSCWAFSTTGNIEGQWKIRTNKLVSLSEQELVDCDKLDEGCGGGLPSNAYKEIIRLGGLETETKYKYDGKDEKCKFLKQDVRVYINSSMAISKNETEIAAWLAKNGPISIGINANLMQFYLGGISHPWKFFCNPKNLDHGVLIVGYGVKGKTPYWIIKNSWGEDWGEKGYYLVYRGSGVCGLNTMCTSSVID